MMHPTWETARRILCIRLDSLGDVLMTTPALRALKESLPGREITLLTSPSAKPVASLVPEIDHVLTYAAPWMKHTPPREDRCEDDSLLHELKCREFDAAVVFTVFSQSPLPAALLCYWAGIPRRLAYCRENPYQLLTDWLPELDTREQMRHEVQRQLDLVATVHARTTQQRLSLTVPADAKERMRVFLADSGLAASRRWLVVHPGATAPSRRYPPEMFAAALTELMQEHSVQVILTGSEEERTLVAQLRANLPSPAISLVGRLNLADFAALIAEAPLLLTNNTGPVHIAAAVGTPVVDLYALTNPQHTPWLVAHRVLNHDVPCQNCFKSVCPAGHHDCLRQVAPAAVVQAVLEMMHPQLESSLCIR